jgi:uncharacterized tellurite resistance protein B-like protein
MFFSSLFESKAKKKVKSHLTNLAALANSDGSMHDKEVEFLEKLANKNGIEKDALHHIIRGTKSHQLVIPDNNSEIFDQIYDLVQMMLADGILEESEMELCQQIAVKFGIRKPASGILIRKIAAGIKEGKSQQTVKAEVIGFL